MSKLPKNVTDIYPLTPMQSLMLLHAFATSLTLSNQFQYRITRALDAARLQRAMVEVTRRHAALRTFFLWEQFKEPLQLVHSEPRVHFETHDLVGEPDPESAYALKDESSRPLILVVCEADGNESISEVIGAMMSRLNPIDIVEDWNDKYEQALEELI